MFLYCLGIPGCRILAVLTFGTCTYILKLSHEKEDAYEEA